MSTTALVVLVLLPGWSGTEHPERFRNSRGVAVDSLREASARLLSLGSAHERRFLVTVDVATDRHVVLFNLNPGRALELLYPYRARQSTAPGSGEHELLTDNADVESVWQHVLLVETKSPVPFAVLRNMSIKDPDYETIGGVQFQPEKILVTRPTPTAEAVVERIAAVVGEDAVVGVDFCRIEVPWERGDPPLSCR